MIRITSFLLLILVYYSTATEPPLVTFNATIDSVLNIHVHMKYNHGTEDTHSSITGFTISFSTEDDEDKREVELLTFDDEYNYTIVGADYDIRQNTAYLLKACVFLHHVETACSETFRLHTRDAAAKAPILHLPEVLLNGSAVFTFVPGEDADLHADYSLEYREVNEIEWRLVQFKADPTSRFVLTGLAANQSYVARLFLTGTGVTGTPSQEVEFDTNNIAELPLLTIQPSTVIQFDPDLSSSLQVQCVAVCQPPAELKWIVNDQSIHLDHSFYTITTSVDGSRSTSLISAKSRTRSDNLTCVAMNAAGEASASVKVHIRGPGSPPSSVTLTSESNAFTVTWLPPSQPNGVIRKYVVYYSQNKDEPLSDWLKMDLDGSERSVKLFFDAKDSFYVRVQAATDDGPGIISDVVAIERDSAPITVGLNYSSTPENILDPGENITVQCWARGLPRPQLSFALSDKEDSAEIESDVWRPLHWKLVDDRVVGQMDVALVSSKTLHCRAKNSVGHNVSSISFKVQKPGDAPRNVRIASVDSRHVVVVWESPFYTNLKIESYELLLFDLSSPDESPLIYNILPREGIDINRLSIRSEDLMPSSEYTCRVRAKNAAGFGPLSDPVAFVTANGGPEAAPHGLTVEINEANTAVLSWQSPNSTSPVENYVIYFTRDFGISNEDFHDWQSTEVTAAVNRFRLDHQVGLKPKSLYRVRITAKNKVTEGPPSNVVEFESAHSLLPIPTEVQATVADDNSVVVTFPAVRDPDDLTKAVQNYKLEVTEGEIPPTVGWQPILNPEVIVDESTGTAEIRLGPHQLGINRSYWLRVSANLDNPTRMVQASKPIHLKTGRGKLQTKAEIEEGEKIFREPGIDESFSFNCVGEGSPAPRIVWLWNGDQVEEGRWKINEETVSDTKTRSIISRTGIQENGFATCFASNSEGNATAGIQLIVLGPGSPPLNVAAVAYRNQLNVSWDPPEISNGEILKYVVYYSFEKSPLLNDWDRIQVDGTNAQIEAIAPSLTHYVKVQAMNALGSGPISQPVPCTSDELYEPLELFVTMEDSPSAEAEPNHPIVLRCHGKGRPSPRIFRYWTDSAYVETEEQVESDESEFSTSFTEITQKNRTLGCRAVNKYERATATLDIVVKKPGDAPSEIEWDFDDVGRLLINWKPVRFPNGNVTYRIYLGHSDVRVPGPPVRWSKEEIPLNVNLNLQISAMNEWGESERSPSVMVRTPNGGPRDAPNITQVTDVASDSFVVHWTPPKKPYGSITGYQLLWRRELEEGWNSVELDGKRTHFNLAQEADLGVGAKIFLKMTAKNERNTGPLSNEFSATSWNPLLPSPKDISAVIRNTTMFIKLDHEKEIQAFTVYIRSDNHTTTVESRVVDNKIVFPVPSEFSNQDAENPKYWIQVVSVSADGRRSEPSVEVEVPVETPPPPRRRLVKEPPL